MYNFQKCVKKFKDFRIDFQRNQDILYIFEQNEFEFKIQ